MSSGRALTKFFFISNVPTLCLLNGTLLPDYAIFTCTDLSHWVQREQSKLCAGAGPEGILVAEGARTS